MLKRVVMSFFLVAIPLHWAQAATVVLDNPVIPISRLRQDCPGKVDEAAEPPKVSPSPVAKQWERVAEGQVRALFSACTQVKKILAANTSAALINLEQRALIRASRTFSHCYATGEGENLGVLSLN